MKDASFPRPISLAWAPAMAIAQLERADGRRASMSCDGDAASSSCSRLPSKKPAKQGVRPNLQPDACSSMTVAYHVSSLSSNRSPKGS